MFIYKNKFIEIKEGTVIYVKILEGGDRPLPPQRRGPCIAKMAKIDFCHHYFNFSWYGIKKAMGFIIQQVGVVVPCSYPKLEAYV